MRRSYGLTLIDLITSVGIVAVLASIAVPSFNTLQRDTARTSAVNGFMHALFFARSTSIMQGRVVTLCKSLDGEFCANDTAHWHDGWIVFANEDGDGGPQRDADEPVLLVNQGWQYGTIRSNRASYSFRPHRQAVVNGTLVFCDDRGAAEARAIIISHTGRPRVARRDSNNRPLQCPTG